MVGVRISEQKPNCFQVQKLEGETGREQKWALDSIWSLYSVLQEGSAWPDH